MIELYWKSSQNLINAMEVYLKIINIDNTMNNIISNIERLNHMKYMRLDSKSLYMNTDMELFRLEIEKNNTTEEKKSLLNQLNISTLQSILNALELTVISIDSKDNDGIEFGIKSLESIYNFIYKDEIKNSIQLTAILSNILDTESKLSKSNNLKLKSELQGVIIKYKTII